MPPHEKLENHLAYLIASVNRQLEEELQERLRTEGVPLEQTRVLAALASKDGRPMGDLAQFVLVDPTTLTKIVDRMVADGLVYRAPSQTDRRKVLIFMSAKGSALQARLANLLSEQERKLVGCLDSTKVRALRDLLMDVARY